MSIPVKITACDVQPFQAKPKVTPVSILSLEMSDDI